MQENSKILNNPKLELKLPKLNVNNVQRNSEEKCISTEKYDSNKELLVVSTQPGTFLG